jgi:hypothetical protein
MGFMKFTPNPVSCPSLRNLGLTLAALTLTAQIAFTHPYASSVTNNSGTSQFIMNEVGATVNVTFEDASAIALGVLAKVSNGFSLDAHSRYFISCTKTGNKKPQRT